MFWKDMNVQLCQIFQEVWFHEKYTSLKISYETNKSNNKNDDYIANSQCCGLYSYGKLSKEN